jgi:hypothetical protein
MHLTGAEENRTAVRFLTGKLTTPFSQILKHQLTNPLRLLTLTYQLNFDDYGTATL